MTRRSLFALMAGAFSARRNFAAEPTPAIQYSLIGNPEPVDVPGASAALTKYGVLVQVFSDQPHAEIFLVTLRYWVPSVCQILEQEKVVRRQRDPVTEVWTLVAFWTGEPVKVIDVKAKEFAFNGRESSIKGKE